MNRPETENRDLFIIADLAKEFGISIRAVRFYKSKGLLSPERVGTTRIFQRRDRARLILRGKRLGFRSAISRTISASMTPIAANRCICSSAKSKSVSSRLIARAMI